MHVTLLAPSLHLASTGGGRRAAAPRGARLVVQAGEGGGGSNGESAERRPKKEKAPVLYEVKVVSPPPRSLGMHQLPFNTQCGETVEVNEQAYVVSRVVYVYKLQKGKYRKSNTRLDVQSSGRYIIDRYFNDLLEAPSATESDPEV